MFWATAVSDTFQILHIYFFCTALIKCISLQLFSYEHSWFSLQHSQVLETTNPKLVFVPCSHWKKTLPYSFFFQCRIKKLTEGVNPRTPCRQLFKELNILTIVSLYILEVINYLRRHHQFAELNSNVHAYNTRRKGDIHIQSYKTDLYKKSVINMGSNLYNKLPDYIKEIESYKTFRKQLKLFLLRHAFYSVEEFVAL